MTNKTAAMRGCAALELPPETIHEVYFMVNELLTQVGVQD